MKCLMILLLLGAAAAVSPLAPGALLAVPAEPSQPAADRTATVAILVFPGVQIIDFTGPYEVFGQGRCRVVTVAEKTEPLTASMGLKIVPTHTLADCPEADILVLPGGNVQPNPAIRDWVRERSAKAKHVLSVCNGAFFLADAGLLDGLSATTFAPLIDELQKLAPQCKVVRDQRFVDNGKIVTTAGLSSGIDGALHVIEKLRGRGFAQEVALNIEYQWQPDVPYARASLADSHLRKALGRGIPLPAGATSKVLRTEGGTDHWEKSWEVQMSGPPAELLKALDARLPAEWKRSDGGTADNAAKRSYTFADADGRAWGATAEASALPQGGVKLVIRLRRAGAGG
jgi:putative intracellular protease/amidase